MHFDDKYKPDVELYRAVTSADLVVLICDNAEQISSVVLVDALSAGRPVVATSFPHAVELLDSAAGRVVPHDDELALVHAIETLLVDEVGCRAAALEAQRRSQGMTWPEIAGRYAGPFSLCHRECRLRSVYPTGNGGSRFTGGARQGGLRQHSQGGVMDTDSVGRTLEDLVETLEDGRKGFEQTADKLAEAGRHDLAGRMRELSGQRARFSAELRALAGGEGIRIDDEGSMAGAVHRGWIALKDALASDEVGAVLGAAETGEDAATRRYRETLAGDLPPQIRAVVAEQALAIEKAHDEVRDLRDREVA